MNDETTDVLSVAICSGSGGRVFVTYYSASTIQVYPLTIKNLAITMDSVTPRIFCQIRIFPLRLCQICPTREQLAETKSANTMVTGVTGTRVRGRQIQNP
jgi:hypothetical protein